MVLYALLAWNGGSLFETSLISFYDGQNRLFLSRSLILVFLALVPAAQSGCPDIPAVPPRWQSLSSVFIAGVNADVGHLKHTNLLCSTVSLLGAYY